MTDQTETPTPSAQDDIKSVLQNTLIEQVQTLLKFTRTEGFTLQIPNTGTHILAGPLARIAAFLRLDDGACATCGAETMIVGGGERICVHCPGDPANFVTFDSTRAAIASQSQAAQPTKQRRVISDAIRHLGVWLEHDDCGCDVEGHTCGRDNVQRTMRELEGLRDAAHIAGTSQAGSPNQAFDAWASLRSPLVNTSANRNVFCAGFNAGTSQATNAQAEPVAWMRDNLSECRTDAEVKHMKTLEFGHWKDIAAKFSIPLYAAPVAKEAQELPDILFDGHAVYAALDVFGHARTSAENVSDVLDAVVRLIRRGIAPTTQQAAKAESEQAVPEGLRKALDELRVVLQMATPSIDQIHEHGPDSEIEKAWQIFYDDVMPALAAAPGAMEQAHVMPPFAAPAVRVHFDDATIEQAALKNVATDFHMISHLVPNYRCTEQFARLKAFAQELASGFREGRNAKPEGIGSSDLAPTTSTVSAPGPVHDYLSDDDMDAMHDALDAKFAAPSSTDQANADTEKGRA